MARARGVPHRAHLPGPDGEPPPVAILPPSNGEAQPCAAEHRGNLRVHDGSEVALRKNSLVHHDILHLPDETRPLVCRRRHSTAAHVAKAHTEREAPAVWHGLACGDAPLRKECPALDEHCGRASLGLPRQSHVVPLAVRHIQERLDGGTQQGDLERRRLHNLQERGRLLVALGLPVREKHPIFLARKHLDPERDREQFRGHARQPLPHHSRPSVPGEHHNARRAAVARRLLPAEARRLAPLHVAGLGAGAGAALAPVGEGRGVEGAERLGKARHIVPGARLVPRDGPRRVSRPRR
mmetsp:Transcript_32194/g.74922  ORF Transcript_32194/g.74922 Transcript_32194/m.74922 type:complete len:296 (+) Transcript_32194:1464-2351(+)